MHKRCKSEFPLDGVGRHGGSWKKTYMEGYLAKMLETFLPGVSSCDGGNGGDDKNNNDGNDTNNNIINVKNNIQLIKEDTIKITNNNATRKNVEKKCPNIYRTGEYTLSNGSNEQTSDSKQPGDLVIKRHRRETEVRCCCEVRLLHVSELLCSFIKSLKITQLKIEPKIQASKENESNNINGNNNDKKNNKNKPSNNVFNNTTAEKSNNTTKTANKTDKLDTEVNNSNNTLLSDNLMLARQSRICVKLMGEEEDDEDEKDHVDFSKVLPGLVGLEEFSVKFSAKKCGSDFRKNNFNASHQDCVNLAKAISLCPNLRYY